jgi:hypothetical protein
MVDVALLQQKREHSFMFCVFIFKDLKNLFNFNEFTSLGKVGMLHLEEQF